MGVGEREPSLVAVDNLGEVTGALAHGGSSGKRKRAEAKAKVGNAAGFDARD